MSPQHWLTALTICFPEDAHGCQLSGHAKFLTGWGIPTPLCNPWSKTVFRIAQPLDVPVYYRAKQRGWAPGHIQRKSWRRSSMEASLFVCQFSAWVEVAMQWFLLADRLRSCEHTSRNVLLACPGLNYWSPTWEYPQKNGKKNPFLLNLWRGKADFSLSKRNFSKLTSLTILADWPRVEGNSTAKALIYSFRWIGHKRTANVPSNSLPVLFLPCVLTCTLLTIFLCSGRVFSSSALWSM